VTALHSQAGAPYGSGGSAPKWPVDAAAADAGMDGPSKTSSGAAAHTRLDAGGTNAGAHKPLGKPAKRPAGFPQRPQAPLASGTYQV
jgi:hypothetical protein